jgi:hypothetical protein
MRATLAVNLAFLPNFPAFRGNLSPGRDLIGGGDRLAPDNPALGYINNRNWILDLAILFKTIRIVLVGWGR